MITHEPILHKMPWAKDPSSKLSDLLSREWLVSNGLGGYAAGTVAGVCTRRFHGLLVAALPAPLGRVMMLNHLSEEARLADGRLVPLGADELDTGVDAPVGEALADFSLDHGMPVWRYQIGDVVLEKSVVMPHLQNTVFVRYRMLEGKGVVRLHMRPSVRFRPHEGRVDAPFEEAYGIRVRGKRVAIESGAECPPLRLLPFGERTWLVLDGGRFRDIVYRVEQSRGYDGRGRLWSPGYFRAELEKGAEATLAASTEPWEYFVSMPPDAAFSTELQRRRVLVSRAAPELRAAPASELVLAADQFVITPTTRVVHAASTRARGDDIRSIIAGYHWFTDWGRDTMIGLEGLTLATGRHQEAGYILRMFAEHARDGLIPNFFPEGTNEGVYHTADATLWFFHALDRYVQHTGDRATLGALLPKLEEIVAKHVEGTRFGIGVDPADWLLKQGAEGYQLTWMDAKVDGWVVTPRRGKAVEINALWYNALHLMERWAAAERGQAAGAAYGAAAARVRESFNARFWNEQAGCLFDVLDGDPKEQALVRPNQLFAVSLPNPVLAEDRWKAVLETCREKLLTPLGLRSLAPGSPDYKACYHGDLRSRDAAYHQGTVWGWLIGPYVDAHLRVHPDDRKGARKLLEGFLPHMNQACVGSISEIFDAEEPFTPRGCVAQAWSVAELLRAWVKTAG